ncbi:MFS transporter [Novosphingobium sp.]|uniref:MFS transporter n=1 Tax=Novosphingobium sp. TaxID=1874826 RepID=UPI0033419BAE
MGNDSAQGLVPATSAADMRLVIAASSAGTVFEWYDFFIYGTLGPILSKTFFPADNAMLSTLLFWLVFAVGFGFRPVGAMVFGFLGDRLGRKYTFLITVVLMGIATAGVGLVPSAAQIGLFAPALVIGLRILQGLALGGEYGGAVVYVAEHAAPERRGFYTSFIQASVMGGFVLSLVVVLLCKATMPIEVWAQWGWRVPFLLSLGLLAVSLWMRLKLSESPVFKAMQDEGELAANPLKESLTYPGNKRRLFVALFGISAGGSVIWYTAMFSGLSLLKTGMRVDDTTAEVLVGVACLFGMGLNITFGWVADRVGRAVPFVGGYVAALLLLFPAAWLIGSSANPALADMARRAPVVVAGADCRYDAFAAEQKTDCGRLLGDLTAAGVRYRVELAPVLALRAGSTALPLTAWHAGDKTARRAVLESALAGVGYNLGKVHPSLWGMIGVVAGLVLTMALSAATYGPQAVILAEMFPPRIRYSSMSIPYHIGVGYFGGFLPFISSLIVAQTGNPYAGLWYTWVVVLVALPIAAVGLRHARLPAAQ